MKLKVWDIVDYDGALGIVTKIDLAGIATVTRENGQATNINKIFLENHIKGSI